MAKGTLNAKQISYIRTIMNVEFDTLTAVVLRAESFAYLIS